ncbi:MAG: SOS response-associated peptidase [Parachlamydia sp.]|nr:SOS response-associated peptidase [Parachlamydia sp.]
MCGRFSLAVETHVISERFEVPSDTFDWHPRYNIAPTQPCPIITSTENVRTLSLMRWGLIPHWSKDNKFQMVNARAETAKSKPSYRDSFRKKRCLVPADGFFEWKKGATGKVPYRATLTSGEPFAFAGLWDSWKDEKGNEIRSFTILTTDSNSLIEPLHDRMPVILKKEDEATWLDTSITELQKLDPLLKPYPATEMKLYEVSPVVNTWKNDTPECITTL